MPDVPAPPGGDARFADADADRPLAIRAEDARDLAVLAALAQDAVLTAADMAWDARARRLSLLVSRFRWEDAEAARAEGRPFERVRALLVIGDVLRLRHDGIDRDDPGTVLSLLSLAWQPGPDGTGTLMLQFAGDGTVAVEAECISVDLRDVARPHRAVAGEIPRHD
ncbi:DUF2948 family protein [Paracoccus contaminans]|uniref:DUF2948 domain-containing protein n=1 Tax=Paracoccus contaminans TaxID=1945662 RepID=A0A1W6CU66_9RHOB|nr:DUF2948 family protein [Paracoccus contaminans]ARJ68408.1 hypothetical protein B0A89_00815 [Paracoccus contaminans]